MLTRIKQQLENTFDKELIKELFDAHQCLTEHYHLGRYRPCSLEGGRFSEIGLRLIQQAIFGTFTPLGTHVTDYTSEILKLTKADKNTFSDSLRIEIPRALQLVHDIRNKRDVGHVGGDVDANYTDATLSLTTCNWIMAELLRIYYTSDINTAQELVDSLIKIRIPLLQDFNGFLKILKPELSVPDKILVLLYYRAKQGATIEELNIWLSNKVQISHMNVTLQRLEHARAFIHRANNLCFITDTGMRYVENNIPLTV
jgi:hypothetical protein